jgi:DNA-directed RNA polymerase specialized sigma24 family protein
MTADKRQPPRARRFPDTLWSVILATRTTNPAHARAALEQLCALYRQPIYHWLRATGRHHHEAEDATQDFFEHLLEGGRLGRLSPCGARFRTWLVTCLRHRLRDQNDRNCAAKRGGSTSHLSFDQLDVPDSVVGPDVHFDRQVAAAIHHRVMSRLRIRWQNQDLESCFDALWRFVLVPPEDGEYGVAGQRVGLTAQQVKRSVFRLRAHYFEAFRAEVAQTVAPEEMADEFRHLVSFLPEVG